MSGQRYRARSRRDPSQYFLRSGALAASLIAQTTITRDDVVVEIGPGRGALTHELVRRCRRLIAVEIDGRLLQSLRREFKGESRVSLVHDDFLRFPLSSEPYKAFGNIPFGRRADIIHRLIEAPVSPTDAYSIVQREAVERFAGDPYASETLQSLLLKPWWQVEIGRRLRRGHFDPPPSVDSVVLWLGKRARPLVDGSQAALYKEGTGISMQYTQIRERRGGGSKRVASCSLARL